MGAVTDVLRVLVVDDHEDRPASLVGMAVSAPTVEPAGGHGRTQSATASNGIGRLQR